MKNTRFALLAALVLAAPSLAHAQDGNVASSASSLGSPSGGTATAGAGAADSGAITNGVTQTTTTSSTSSEGIGPDGLALSVDDTTALPGTGGEPIAMSLLGLSMMVGAFAVRRRISA